VRHVRILGLCLVALFAVSAMASSSAMASCGGHGQVEEEFPSGQIRCETPKEHASYVGAFDHCPVHAVETCAWAESFYKASSTWKTSKMREESEPEPTSPSYFTAGKVTVPLKASITLRGGVSEIPEQEGSTPFEWKAPVGAPTIEPAAQATIPITKGVNTSLLSHAELTRYNYFVKVAKQTKTYATVELAGPAEQIRLYPGNLLAEEGTAFRFAVKVKLSNPFLGEECYVGSNEAPITVPFSTGSSGPLKGKIGRIVFENGGESLVIWGDTLVASEFESPGVHGCGVEGGADEAVDSALGLPSATGNASVLNGVQRLTGAEGAEEVGL